MNRLLIPFLLLLGIILLLLAQCTWVYRWPMWGVRWELLPALLLYAAFTLNLSTALVLALLAAAMYDSFTAGHFGASMLPYVVSTALFCGVRPIFFRNRITTQLISGFVFGMVTLSLQWVLCGKFSVSFYDVMPKLARLALMTGILSVVYFAVLDAFFRAAGVDPGRFEEQLV